MSTRIFRILFGWHEREQRTVHMSPFLDPPCSSGVHWSNIQPIVKHNIEAYIHRRLPLVQPFRASWIWCGSGGRWMWDGEQFELQVFWGGNSYFITNVEYNFQNWHLQILYFWWNVAFKLNLRCVLFAGYRECEAGVAQSESLHILC